MEEKIRNLASFALISPLAAQWSHLAPHQPTTRFRPSFYSHHLVGGTARTKPDTPFFDAALVGNGRFARYSSHGTGICRLGSAGVPQPPRVRTTAPLLIAVHSASQARTAFEFDPSLPKFPTRLMLGRVLVLPCLKRAQM